MYECTICHGINHPVHLSCQYCGTIPARYSVLNRPTKLWLGFGLALDEVVIAHGVDRQEWHHTVKVPLRTVRADYYAQE